MSFHYFRRSFWPSRNLLNRLWSYHDRNPLPPAINLAVRQLIGKVRNLDIRLKSKQKKFIYGKDNSLKTAPRLFLLKRNEPVSLEEKDVLQRFEHVHAVNEELYCADGFWVPQPMSEYYGKGISIEEIALRIRGYLSAYRAGGNPLYLNRAEKACHYLLNKRIYKDGHLFLQGHITIDIPYAFAGEALLCMWAADSSSNELLNVAKKIGDRLVAYQISGSVNHAVVPVQFLGQLYQATGEKKYLKNCVKRLFRSAVPYQLPYGGWLGHESWLWYHSLILRSLIVGYASIPNTLEYYAKKDRLACSIIAAINCLLLSQNADGSFPLRPPEPICEHTDDKRFLSEKAVFMPDQTFQRVQDNGTAYGSWNGYVIDALVTAYELLDTKEIIPCLHQFARNIAMSEYVWRLEFDTLGAGRLLEHVQKLLSGKKDQKPALKSAVVVSAC